MGLKFKAAYTLLHNLRKLNLAYKENNSVKSMVRVVGLEPTLRKERHFECRASTNFTTPASQISTYKPLSVR